MRTAGIGRHRSQKSEEPRMRMITGFLTLYTYLLFTALLYNAPLLLVVGFAAAAIYMIWRIEWFDVWRHGVPPVGYMLTAFGPYSASVAAAGWGLGALVVPRARVAPRISLTVGRS
jgi:hypothetical protein